MHYIQPSSSALNLVQQIIYLSSAVETSPSVNMKLHRSIKNQLEQQIYLLSKSNSVSKLRAPQELVLNSRRTSSTKEDIFRFSAT